MSVTREQVREILESAGGLNPHLVNMLNEEHRKINHEIAKRNQPEVLTVLHGDDLARLRAECSKPTTEEERQQSGLDLLCQTVRDTLESGDTADIVYALVRVWRKAWGVQQGHLGPIEGVHGVLRRD